MPALPAVSKVVRLDVHESMNEDSNIQIHEYFSYVGTLSAADAGTWLANMVAGYNTHVMADKSNKIKSVLFELTDLTSNTAPQVQNSTGVVGASGTAPVPAGVAMVLKKHISRRYRGGHPRVYLAGIPNTALFDSGSWVSASLAAITGDYLAFVAACTAGTNPAAIGAIAQVNVSYFSGYTNHTFPSGRVKPIPTPRVVPVVDVVTTMLGNPVPGSQRRRNRQP